jgi:cytochrome P450
VTPETHDCCCPKHGAALALNPPSICCHQSSGELFTREELVPEIAIFVAAGFETTSHQVGLLLYHIARRPEVQQRIKDELRTFGLLKEGGATAR